MKKTTTFIEVETASGDVCQFHRPTLKRILDLSYAEDYRHSKAEVASEELDRVWDAYHASVNMAHSELEKWAGNPCSHMASLSRAPINRNLHLLSTPKSDWGNKEISDANKTIAFVARMSANSSGEPVSDECPMSKRTISLMNWAHDPNKSTKAERALKKVLSKESPVALKSEEERTVFGLILEPNDGEDGAPLYPDAQGEIYSRPVIRKAAHEWMLNHRMFDVQHEIYLGEHQAKVVESYLAPVDFDLTMPDGSSRRVYRGSWLIVVKVFDEKLWEAIKDGKLTGFSMNGFVSREKVKVRRKKSTQKAKSLCFYHRDQDGAMSAAIVLRAMDEPVDLVSVQYGESFPFELLDGMEKVFMVDFMIQPFSEMECFAEMCDAMGIELTLIDHHYQSIESLNNSDIAGKISGIQYSAESEGPVSADNLKAGCDLTWEFLFKEKEKPAVVKLIGRWDVWDHEDELVRPIAFALEAIGPNPYKYEKMLDDKREELEVKFGDIGRAIYQWSQLKDDIRIKSSSFKVDFGGVNCLAVNTDAKGSIQFEGIEKLGIDDCHAGITFKLLKTGIWSVSMYALSDDIDVGSVCSQHGGSGHRSAGGFQCKDLPFQLPS
jgi:hypothetical protein